MVSQCAPRRENARQDLQLSSAPWAIIGRQSAQAHIWPVFSMFLGTSRIERVGLTIDVITFLRSNFVGSLNKSFKN